MSQPIENLRKRHRLCESCVYSSHWYSGGPKHCFTCLDAWPCDTNVALDALEKEIADLNPPWPDGLQARIEWARRHPEQMWFEHDAREDEATHLQDRLDAAIELIRLAVQQRHGSFQQRYTAGGWFRSRACGSSVGTSIETCEFCRPYRELLEGKEGEGQ